MSRCRKTHLFEGFIGWAIGLSLVTGAINGALLVIGWLR